MTLAVTITMTDVFTKIRSFLIDTNYGIVPAGTRVLRGPINNAAQPADPHVIMTPLLRRRIRTNQETDVDPYPAPLPGEIRMEAGMEVTIQADFYGPEAETWAQTFATVWRSEYGVRHLAPTLAPLYADDARMMPLVTGEEQYLERWLVRAVLQYNPVTVTPQEFAGSATVEIINVDERYPP